MTAATPRARARSKTWSPPAWLAPAVVGVGLAGLTAWAWPAREAPDAHVREGNRAYEHREFPRALEQYEAAPGDGVPGAGVHLNRGLARFRMAVPPGDGGALPELGPDAAVPEGYERAQDEIRNAARGTAGAPMEDIDAVLRARASYDLGNTYFARHAWQQAIDAYKEALRLRPGWLNAAWNLEIVRRRKDDDEHPDAGPDAGQDGGQDASQDASRDAAQDSGGDSGSPNDGGDQGDSGGQGDGGSQGDSGSNPRDGGSDPGDAGNAPDPNRDGGAPPPTSLAPLDQLERNEQDLQQLLMRRRAATMPRSPDDER